MTAAIYARKSTDQSVSDGAGTAAGRMPIRAERQLRARPDSDSTRRSAHPSTHDAGECRYLLSGVLRCGQCGAGMEARSRKHGKTGRMVFYGCSAFQRKGSHICPNRLTVPMDTADAAVLEALKAQLLAPTIIEEALGRAVEQLTAPKADDAPMLAQRISTLESEVTQLANALAQGGNLHSLLDALKARETELLALRQQSMELKRPDQPLDSERVREGLRQVLRQWARSLTKHPTQARLMVQRLVEGRLVMQPREDEEGQYYEFTGTGTALPAISGVLPHKLASPTRLPVMDLTGPVAA